MAIRIAINGYGRIGRNVLRAIYELNLTSEFKVVAVNASGDLATNAHLTKFDTVHGRFNADVKADVEGGWLRVNDTNIKFFSTFFISRSFLRRSGFLFGILVSFEVKLFFEL